jgi:hypothetical protein
VRLSPEGRPVGLVGLQVVDLGAGGVRVRAGEPLVAGERVRLALRLDRGQPLKPVVDVLVGGIVARGRFAPMPEAERRRIVRYVYRQNLAGRLQAQISTPLD